MLKLALIINNKVHIIEEIDAVDLDEVYAKYRSRELSYMDITNDTREIQEGWPVVDGVIQEPIPSALSLDELKALKRTLISAACKSAIEAGFTSSALGEPHTYDSADEDQRNLLASVQAFATAQKVGQQLDVVPYRCTRLSDNVRDAFPHNEMQMNVVYADWLRHWSEQMIKNNDLKRQVDLATTSEELDAINW